MEVAIFDADRATPHGSGRGRRDAGAALLAALLIVTLVATLAAGSVWRQWRQFETERAQRVDQQNKWLLLGLQDWAKVMLREDARAGPVDHLQESWARPRHVLPLPLRAENLESLPENVEMVLVITDLQSRLNVNNLVDDVVVSEEAVRAFRKLFHLLALPDSELDALVDNLRRSRRMADGAGPFPPKRLEQLIWFGLSARSLDALRPHVALLPERTPLNLNTAGPEVIYAGVPELEWDQVRRLVQERTLHPFASVDQAMQAAGLAAVPVDAVSVSTGSRYFEAIGSLQQSQLSSHERWMMLRDSDEVTTLAHERHRP